MLSRDALGCASSISYATFVLSQLIRVHPELDGRTLDIVHSLKVLANEDTLSRTHFCRHKCFPVCPRAQHLLRTQFCVRDTKNVSDFVQKHFVSATNVSQFARGRKRHEQQCVRNNVSSFASTLTVFTNDGLSGRAVKRENEALNDHRFSLEISFSFMNCKLTRSRHIGFKTRPAVHE